MKSKYTKYILLFLFPISGIIVWYIDKLINKFIFFPENYLTYLMQILGLVSISLLSLNFVLSLKTRTTEKIFGGLDDQYKLHKLVGKIAMITIIFHIGFGIIRSLPSAKAFSLYLIPGTNVNYNFGIFAFWILIVLIFITLYLKLPYHIWKFTHRFLILPLILSVIHIVLTSYSPTQVPLIVTFLIVIGLIGF